MRKFLYGKNTVVSALSVQNASVKVKELYLSKKPSVAVPKDVKVFVKDLKYLNKMTNTQNHQGYVALVEGFKYYSLEDVLQAKPQVVVFLDHLEDVHNLGSIMRTANALGVKHIFIPKRRATQVTPAALKVSSGGFVNMQIVQVNSLVDAALKLRKEGFWIYASSLDKAQDIKNVSFNFPLLMIIGNEKKGVSNSLVKLCDQKVKINMKGTVQSLNASVAAGILLFKITSDKK